jgi:hypothetical protein
MDPFGRLSTLYQQNLSQMRISLVANINLQGIDFLLLLECDRFLAGLYPYHWHGERTRYFEKVPQIVTE